MTRNDFPDLTRPAQPPDDGWYALPASVRRPPPASDDLLVVPTDLVTKGWLDHVNTVLESYKTGWQLQGEGPATNPLLTALKAIAPATTSAKDPVRVAADLLPLLRHAGLTDVEVDANGRGVPAGKPSFAHFEISLVGAAATITRGDFSRVPVSVAWDPPPIPVGGRRPVVALFDTTIDRQHPWLGPPGPNGFWETPSANEWNPGPSRPAPDDASPFATLPSHIGHGTFSAGIIRQVAPCAHVLSMPIMEDDGTVYADHLINALGWLNKQETGFVDVVCLPLTLGPRLPRDSAIVQWLRRILGELGEKGVQVVVAAGNGGTAVPTYPGAFTLADKLHQPRTPLITVGALNSNGTSVAFFSNHGRWVTAYAPGASVVSAFPRIDGPGRSELYAEVDGIVIESDDGDAYRSGFVRWSGCSFATVHYAARIAQDLANT